MEGKVYIENREQEVSPPHTASLLYARNFPRTLLIPQCPALSKRLQLQHHDSKPMSDTSFRQTTLSALQEACYMKLLQYTYFSLHLSYVPSQSLPHTFWSVDHFLNTAGPCYHPLLQQTQCINLSLY